MATTVAQRRRSAHAAAIAAKQRRQKIQLGILLAIVVGGLAWEAPGVIKHLRSSSSSPSAVAEPAPTGGYRPRSLPKRFRNVEGDPFVVRALTSGDSQVAPSSGRDPFTAPEVASESGSPAPQPLPQQIVIGTPSAKGIAESGWIVILASIPTRESQDSALRFARAARARGVTSVSVLNSSNRRPLRGGYWVVYTGPVQTLANVEQIASFVHAKGYVTAYIRQLIIYK